MAEQVVAKPNAALIGHWPLKSRRLSWMQGLRSTRLSNGAGCGQILKIFPILN